MYKTFMIVAIAVIALGWITYGVYNFIMDQREKKRPSRSQRLEEARGSMADYAKKIAKFERKRYQQDQQ